MQRTQDSTCEHGLPTTCCVHVVHLVQTAATVPDSRACRQLDKDYCNQQLLLGRNGRTHVCWNAHCPPVVLVFKLAVSIVCGGPPCAEVILLAGWRRREVEAAGIHNFHLLSSFHSGIFMLQNWVTLQIRILYAACVQVEIFSTATPLPQICWLEVVESWPSSRRASCCSFSAESQAPVKIPVVPVSATEVDSKTDLLFDEFLSLMAVIIGHAIYVWQSIYNTSILNRA